jgi:hypothetical protein
MVASFDGCFSSRYTADLAVLDPCMAFTIALADDDEHRTGLGPFYGDDADLRPT